MNKAPSFQWYPRDILSSARVQEMSLAEEGAYRRLLDYCWLNGSVPADPARAAKLIGKGCSTKIAKVALTMFQAPRDAENLDRVGVPSMLIHDRLEAERAKQATYSEKNRAAANARWQRPNTQQVSPEVGATADDANALHTHSERIAKPNAQLMQTECSSSSSACIMESTSIIQSTSIPNIHMSNGDPANDENAPPDPPAKFTPDAQAVFDYWRVRTNHPQATFSRERKLKITARLREGFSLDQCKRAIEGCLASPHHQGQNDTGTVYDSIELIFRNASKLEQFISYADLAQSRKFNPTHNTPRKESENARRRRELQEAISRDLQEANPATTDPLVP